MWTGRQTLASIENAIAKAHGEESDLDLALRSAVQEVERLRQERSQALRELARVKLDEMTAGRLVDSLDAGERRALQLLDGYRQRLTTAAARRDLLVKEVAEAEAQRDAAAAALERTLAELEEIRTATEAKVQNAPAWQQAKRALDTAEAIAAEAEKKAEIAEDELGSKRKPYDDDPLFVYLWRRKFGTRDYDAGSFSRFVDGRVADFLGYRDARANYSALIDIPLRLREHATAKRAEAAERAAELADIEHEAMLDLGAGQQERALADARHKLAVADRAVEDKNAALRQVDADRQGLVSGTDPAYEQALQTIASADSMDEIAALYREARRTPTGADDALVRKVEDIDAVIARSEGEVTRLRKSAEEVARRRLEMQRVRDRFRTSGYDHPSSTFGNDNVIAETIGRVLQGVATSGVLWDLLKGNHDVRKRRGRPGFGGANFPFPFPMPGGRGPWSGGDWRDPESRGGWWPRDDDDDDDDWRRGRDGGRRRKRWREDDDDDDDDYYERSKDRFRTGGSF